MLNIIRKLRVPRAYSVPVQCFSSASVKNAKIKAGKGKKGGDVDEEGGNDDESLDNLVKFYEAVQDASRADLGFSPEELEEHKRIGRNYRLGAIRYNNNVGKDLSNKIWLMHEAIRSLPPNLRAQAEIIDETPPPPDRPVGLFDTPPVKDFDATKFSGYGDSKDDDDEVASSPDDYLDPTHDEYVFSSKAQASRKSK